MIEGRNYVITRATPDWLSFDLEDTRAFCARIGFAETLIIDFAARWDAALALSFLEYRAAMKVIAFDLIHDVRDAAIVTSEDLGGLSVASDDLLYFTDDDDWVRPDLFQRLRERGPSDHGWVWRSPAVAKMFGDPPAGLDGGSVVHDRAVDRRIHTNNYAVTGRAWNAIGREGLFEHFSAQGMADQGVFRPEPINEPLSAANKHMCCTLAVARNSGIPSVFDDLAQGLAQYQAHLAQNRLPPHLAWLAQPIEALMAVNARALAPPNTS